MSYKCSKCSHTQYSSGSCLYCGTTVQETDHTGAIIGAAVGYAEDGIEGAIIGGLLGSMFDD